VAPPLKSGPEARDTSVEVLRLRRAAQTDSALPRSASWAMKHMDEEEARQHLEEELRKAKTEQASNVRSPGPTATSGSGHVPRPPQQPNPGHSNSSPRRKNTSVGFLQVSRVRSDGLHAARDVNTSAGAGAGTHAHTHTLSLSLSHTHTQRHTHTHTHTNDSRSYQNIYSHSHSSLKKAQSQRKRSGFCL